MLPLIVMVIQILSKFSQQIFKQPPNTLEAENCVPAEAEPRIRVSL